MLIGILSKIIIMGINSLSYIWSNMFGNTTNTERISFKKLFYMGGGSKWAKIFNITITIVLITIGGYLMLSASASGGYVSPFMPIPNFPFI